MNDFLVRSDFTDARIIRASNARVAVNYYLGAWKDPLPVSFTVHAVKQQKPKKARTIT